MLCRQVNYSDARDNTLFALFVLAAVAVACELMIRIVKRRRAGSLDSQGNDGSTGTK